MGGGVGQHSLIPKHPSLFLLIVILCRSSTFARNVFSMPMLFALCVICCWAFSKSGVCIREGWESCALLLRGLVADVVNVSGPDQNNLIHFFTSYSEQLLCILNDSQPDLPYSFNARWINNPLTRHRPLKSSLLYLMHFALCDQNWFSSRPTTQLPPVTLPEVF